MARNRRVEDLSAGELRRLLVENRRAARQERLDHFRRTGRLVVLTPEENQAASTNTAGDPEARDVEAEAETPRSRLKKRRKDALDRILLGIEILAVIGLIFIVINGVSVLRDLNREVGAALVQPTLTPTALIAAVVLPSGHTPPDTPGGPRPNEEEIPEHLRPLVQILAQVPVPTPGPENAVRIQIPAIGVDAPVVQGDGWEQLKKGVGQMVGSVNPGVDGNLILSAHNDIFGEIFRDLDRLQPGDEVQVSTNQRTFTYTIVASQIVEPTMVDVLAQSAQPTLTLISCYPYLVDTQRIVISASIVE